MAHDRIKIVADNIRKGSYKKVLNIGLGEGSLEREITDMYVRNKKWYGIDISKQTVQTCKERFSNGIFNIGSVSKLPYKSNYFDCIVALEVLEHIKPRKILKSLSEIQRVAKKDAILIISVPLNEGLLELVKKGSNPNAHLRVYTKELLSAELEIAGFRVYWEKYLFAFGKNYKIKTILCRYIYKSYRMPNVVIVKANKK